MKAVDILQPDASKTANIYCQGNGVMLVFWQAKTESKLDTYVQKLAFSFFDHLN